ncbi:uroporphyrinogen-III C-methyltransferase [Niveibacterium sp.]|uniref:uroporphyrinogen-III C-methyltransferase n=1 Tax=Niveibacterium sp. TaxID=2017444 RepID=UPI0035B30608
MDTPSENPTPVPPPVAPAAPSGRRGWRSLGHPLVIAGAVVLALLAWQWIETRAQLEVLKQQVAQRLGESDAATREVKGRAKEIQDSIQAMGNRLAVQEARMAESQGQQAALEALYQDLSRSRDEWVLAEVEQALNIAQQQLQLAGNVQAALIALQSAEARLAGFERPQLLPLRKSIARDIERLKALPLADISAMGLALENLIDRVDTLPLAFEHSPPKQEKVVKRPVKGAKPVEQSAPEIVEPPAWYARLVGDFWSELRGLIRIERLDRPDPALLSPSQTVFLRENLRLRLLSARLALLQRDGRVFREDTKQAAAWMERYFDVEDREVAMRLADLRKAQGARLSVELPNLNETLGSLHSARVAGAR